MHPSLRVSDKHSHAAPMLNRVGERDMMKALEMRLRTGSSEPRVGIALGSVSC